MTNKQIYDVRNLNLFPIDSYENLLPIKSPMEVLYMLVSILEEDNVKFAIGGGFAFSNYAITRVTGNININIWPKDKNEINRILKSLDSKSPVKFLQSTVESLNIGILRFFWYEIKIEIFFFVI